MIDKNRLDKIHQTKKIPWLLPWTQNAYFRSGGACAIGQCVYAIVDDETRFYLKECGVIPKLPKNLTVYLGMDISLHNDILVTNDRVESQGEIEAYFQEKTGLMVVHEETP